MRGERGAEKDDPLLSCSFCSKGQNQVLKLVTNGKGCIVCNECAQVVIDMVEYERDSRTPDH